MEPIQVQDVEVSPTQKQETNTLEKVPIFAYYNRATKYVHEQQVNIDEALELLHKQPSKLQYGDNYIGFKTKISSQMIQFVKLEENKWLFDIPLYGDLGHKYDWTEEVFKAIDEFDKITQFVELYFEQGNLFTSLQTYQYDEFLAISANMGIQWQGKFAENIYGK